MSDLEQAAAAQTVDEHLVAIADVDARTRAGKTTRHHARMAELALERERRENAENIRALTSARDSARSDAQALVDAAQRKAEQVVAEYREKITTLTPDYEEGHPTKVTSPRLPDEHGRQQFRRFTLHEIEEATIRFRVAGAGDLAPISLDGGSYRGPESIECHVRDELMEAREQRDLRKAREAHAVRAQRIQRAVGAIVIPPAALLLLAGLKWTYLLLIGWVI